MMRRRELMGMQGMLKTVSGPIVTVNDALARNAKSLVVNFAPIQASGTPSPDNVLPISGWTGVTGYRTGENLITTNPVAIVHGAKADSSTGEIVHDNYLNLFVYPVPNGTLYAKRSSSSEYYCGLSDSPSLGGGDTVDTVWNFHWGVASVENTRRYLYFSGSKNYDYPFGVCVTVGYTADSVVAPYTGTTYPVDWTDVAGTVYGGYVDLVSGVLVADTVSEIWGGNITISEDSVFIGTNASKFYAQIARSRNNSGSAYCNYLVRKIETALSNENKYVFDGRAFNHVNLLNSLTGIVKDTDTKATAIQKFKEYLTSHPLQFVYTLAAPITYQLTPQTITMLKGTNNVWSNANGNVSLTYYAQ